MKMSEDKYLKWLSSLVIDTKSEDPSETFDCLLAEMHKIPFMWYISNDVNRAEDGKSLRIEFTKYNSSYGWGFYEPCTFLELTISLARRMSQMIGGPEDYYFWELLQNIGLDYYRDSIWDEYSEQEVHNIINSVIQRNYDRFGLGGFFPVKVIPDKVRAFSGSMAEEELWIQLCAYVNETLNI